MLRLYRQTAEQLLLLTLYNKKEIGISLAQMGERLRQANLNDYTENQILKQARSTRIPDKALEDLFQTLMKGLINDTQGGGETDLIDRIVTALQTPFTRNVLSGESLSRLRNALLLPSEAGGLIARLTSKEMSCGSCGKPLHDGESVTLSRDARHGQVILCHRCVAPQSVPCATCEGTASLSTKAMNAMSRMQCPTCLDAKVTVPKKGEKSSAESIQDRDDAPAPRFTIPSRYQTMGRPGRGVGATTTAQVTAPAAVEPNQPIFDPALEQMMMQDVLQRRAVVTVERADEILLGGQQ